MDLRTLVIPVGSPLKLFPYMLLIAFIGSSGWLVVSLQYADYLWALSTVLHVIVYPLVLLATAWAIHELFGPRLSTAVALALAVLLGCLLGQALTLWITEEILLLGPHPEKTYLYRLGLVRGALLWWGLAGAAWYAFKRAEERTEELSRAEIASEELRASMAEAKLQALQAQVEPHFLFNTLAHVKWLYRSDPVLGRRMLDRFLDYLHAALPRVRESETTLERELQLAHAYLDLQQLRIGERLEFKIEAPPELARVSFPPLMLLTLVENAIKHGISPQPGGGSIGIRAHVDEHLLRIEVRDTGAGLRESAGSGMGLANVRERLKALFGAGARLVIEPNAPHGVVAAIEIPQ